MWIWLTLKGPLGFQLGCLGKHNNEKNNYSGDKMKNRYSISRK